MTNQISDNKNENYKYNIQYIIYEKYIFKLICILYQLKYKLKIYITNWSYELKYRYQLYNTNEIYVLYKE